MTRDNGHVFGNKIDILRGSSLGSPFGPKCFWTTEIPIHHPGFILPVIKKRDESYLQIKMSAVDTNSPRLGSDSTLSRTACERCRRQKVRDIPPT